LEGKSVVYDDTNAKKEHRDKLKEIAQECSSTAKIVFLDTQMTENVLRFTSSDTIESWLETNIGKSSS